MQRRPIAGGNGNGNGNGWQVAPHEADTLALGNRRLQRHEALTRRSALKLH